MWTLEIQCSAVIPVYNSGSYVIEAIDSLLLQNVKLTKIIVVDDGSTDNTLELIKQKYACQIRSGLIFIHPLLLNSGVSNARNIGVSLVETEWVLFLDADDVLHPDAVGLLSRKAEEVNTEPTQPYHLVHSAYQLIDKDSTVVSDKFAWRQVGFDETLGWAFYRNHIISTSGVLVNREGFNRLGGFDCSLSRNEDLDLWLRFAHYSGVGYVDSVITSIRRHDGNVSSSLTDMLNAERLVLLRYAIEDIRLALMQRSCSDCKNISDFVSILFRLNEYECGYREANRAISQLSDCESLHFFTGLYWIHKKNFEKAIVEFLHCMSKNITHGAVLNNLGACYLCLGEVNEANNYFVKSLELYPNYMDAINNQRLLVDGAFNVDFVRFTWRELRPVLTSYTQYYS